MRKTQDKWKTKCEMADIKQNNKINMNGLNYLIKGTDYRIEQQQQQQKSNSTLSRGSVDLKIQKRRKRNTLQRANTSRLKW